MVPVTAMTPPCGAARFFFGSVSAGFARVAHLRTTPLPGGDAAAAYPVQAAAGYLFDLSDAHDFCAPPFYFSARFHDAVRMVQKDVRTFTTSSMGRLFDAAAALVGFTREATFEGQAAMWLEQLACSSRKVDGYEFPFVNAELDFRPVMRGIIRDRLCGRDSREIARAFHRSIAVGLKGALTQLCSAHNADTIVLSGGVFQNELLLSDLKMLLERDALEIWTNHAVPANDGGISLGQAALAAFNPPGVFGDLDQCDSRNVERAA